MKTLPRSITGFGSANAGRPWKEVGKPVKDVIYACGSRVIGELPCNDDYARNYHIVYTDQVTVLVNGVHPVVAFTSAKEKPYMEIPFVEWSRFEETMKERYPDWICLSPAFLGQKPTDELLEELGESEKEELEYWKTKTVGDIIFNNWD